MKNSLKPCPFCGYKYIYANQKEEAYCDICKAKAPYYRWNNRIKEQLLEHHNKKLEEDVRILKMGIQHDTARVTSGA
jgi:hypothetical protein